MADCGVEGTIVQRLATAFMLGMALMAVFSLDIGPVRSIALSPPRFPGRRRPAPYPRSQGLSPSRSWHQLAHCYRCRHRP